MYPWTVQDAPSEHNEVYLYTCTYIRTYVHMHTQAKYDAPEIVQ